MKFFSLLAAFCIGGALSANAQENIVTPARKPAEVGFGIALYDFGTALRIRRNSLASTINNKQIAKFSEMGPGASVHYSKGLGPKLDFAASLGFGSGTVYLQNNLEKGRSGGFITADAGIHLKLLTDAYAVNPFLSAGLGATVTQGFYGAVVPVGAGIRFRITDEAALLIQSQYRSAVTETAGYHFVHGITIMGRL